jgi:hypothetical protein
MREAVHLSPREIDYLRRVARRMLGGRAGERSSRMNDLWTLAATLALFGLTAAFVRLCERM